MWIIFSQPDSHAAVWIIRKVSAWQFSCESSIEDQINFQVCNWLSTWFPILNFSWGSVKLLLTSTRSVKYNCWLPHHNQFLIKYWLLSMKGTIILFICLTYMLWKKMCRLSLRYKLCCPRWSYHLYHGTPRRRGVHGLIRWRLSGNSHTTLIVVECLTRKARLSLWLHLARHRGHNYILWHLRMSCKLDIQVFGKFRLHVCVSLS